MTTLHWPGRFDHVDRILDKPGPSTDDQFQAGAPVKDFLRTQCKILVIGAGGASGSSGLVLAAFIRHISLRHALSYSPTTAPPSIFSGPLRPMPNFAR